MLKRMIKVTVVLLLVLAFTTTPTLVDTACNECALAGDMDGQGNG